MFFPELGRFPDILGGGRTSSVVSMNTEGSLSALILLFPLPVMWRFRKMKRHSSDATERSGLAGPQTVHILPQFLWSWFLFSSIGSHSPNRTGALEDFGSSVLLPRAFSVHSWDTEASSAGLFQYTPLPLQAAAKDAFMVQGCHLVSIMRTAASGQKLTGSGLRALPALISSNPFLALQELSALYV